MRLVLFLTCKESTETLWRVLENPLQYESLKNISGSFSESITYVNASKSWECMVAHENGFQFSFERISWLSISWHVERVERSFATWSQCHSLFDRYVIPHLIAIFRPAFAMSSLRLHSPWNAFAIPVKVFAIFVKNRECNRYLWRISRSDKWGRSLSSLSAWRGSYYITKSTCAGWWTIYSFFKNIETQNPWKNERKNTP